MAVTLSKAHTTLNKLLVRQEQLENLKKQSGVLKLEAEVEKLKTQVTDFMIESEVDQLVGNGAHATLIKGTYDSRVIGTADDLREGDPEDAVIPLRTLIFKKFKKTSEARNIWFRCSRRMVDLEMLEQVVAEGTLSIEDVSPAFMEKKKKPYIRIFKDK
jgi:hypothetical protein